MAEPKKRKRERLGSLSLPFVGIPLSSFLFFLPLSPVFSSIGQFHDRRMYIRFSVFFFIHRWKIVFVPVANNLFKCF